eukprot:1163012-Ditylum_brightwellii.AAC.1
MMRMMLSTHYWMTAKLMTIVAHMKMMHAEPYDDDEMHINDKTCGNNKINYSSKACINNFWYYTNYESHDGKDKINNNVKP